jgi:hypothetical protein
MLSTMTPQKPGDPDARMRPADVVLHPVRLRIVQAFLGDRELTTGDLRREIADVPSATLYRQVAALARGEVLEVVDEKRVRGAVERTYRLRTGAARVQDDEARELTTEEHRQLFMTFVAGLLADFDRYLDRGDVDMARDLAGFRQNAMYLTDEEMVALVQDLRAVFDPRIALPPAPGRTRRLFSTIVVPDARAAPTTTSADDDPQPARPPRKKDS